MRKPGRHENRWTVEHRMSGTPEYKSWQGMRARCENVRDKDYARYGARGVKVCERWGSFENFFADMGVKPSVAHSIDRRENNGDYTPDNCRWASKAEQVRNRSNTVSITLNGETRPLSVWCADLGINYYTAYSRLAKGWPPERAMKAIEHIKARGGIRAVA